MTNKMTTEHKGRQACIYIRQSTSGQVLHHRESQRLQYRLVERAKELGWGKEYIRVIDSDLGTTASGCVDAFPLTDKATPPILSLQHDESTHEDEDG